MFFHRIVPTIAMLGAIFAVGATPSSAIESTCPAPCDVPPKTAFFARDAGTMLGDVTGLTTTNPLWGKLQRGIAHTVVRIDASIRADVIDGMTKVAVSASVNGQHAGPSGNQIANCNPTGASTCSVTGSFWFDIDALEAAHPGQFVGQPLELEVRGSASTAPPWAGFPYEVTFSAQVVKKK